MTKFKRFVALMLGGAMCASLAFGAACSNSGSDDGNTDNGGETPVVETATATVTYDSNGGSSVEATTVEVGSTIGTMPTTTRTGYNFLGWYYSYGSLEVQVTSDYPIPCDVTLTAKWSKVSNFYLDYQNYLVVETGEYFSCRMYDTSYNIDDNAYITLTKSGTSKTLEEAESAGWITDYYMYNYGDSIGIYAYFGQAGDYTITAYSYTQTCSTVVTVIGDTITTSSSTTTTVTFDKIKYIDTEYKSGDSITSYSYNQIYVYFNAPSACEAKVTYTYTDEEGNTDSGILGTSYYSNSYVYAGYSDGQYYVYINTNYLATGYTYTVKVTSASGSSAEATFTLAAPTGDTRKLTTAETSVTANVGDWLYDYYYVYSTTNIYGVSYNVVDAEGNDVSNAGYIDLWYNQYGNNVYRIYYQGYFYSEGTYTLTVTPYDEEYNKITVLSQSVTVTVSESDSSSSTSTEWYLNNTDSEGNTDYYYDYFAAGESKTIQYVADTEYTKVAVAGVYINSTSATTITLYNGSTISAIYSVADGKTTVSLTIKVADTSNVCFYLMGSNADGSVQNRTRGYAYVLSDESISIMQTRVAAVKYSIETYFSSLTGEGGELNEIYTKLAAYTAASTVASYAEAYELIDEVSSAIDTLSTTIYDSTKDYTSSLITALESKTALCGTILHEYYYYYCESYTYSYLLTGRTVASDMNLYYLGMEEYLLIKVSDKDICDSMYNYIFDGEDIDEIIEAYDEYYDGMISAAVTAHDSGTEAEYIAAMNTLYLTMY